MIFILKLSKGEIIPKNVGGVMVLNLCTLSDHALYLYQVSRKYLKEFLSYWADTISIILKFSEGHNSVKNAEV